MAAFPGNEILPKGEPEEKTEEELEEEADPILKSFHEGTLLIRRFQAEEDAVRILLNYTSLDAMDMFSKRLKSSLLQISSSVQLSADVLARICHSSPDTAVRLGNIFFKWEELFSYCRQILTKTNVFYSFLQVGNTERALEYQELLEASIPETDHRIKQTQVLINRDLLTIRKEIVDSDIGFFSQECEKIIEGLWFLKTYYRDHIFMTNNLDSLIKLLQEISHAQTPEEKCLKEIKFKLVVNSLIVTNGASIRCQLTNIQETLNDAASYSLIEMNSIRLK